MIKFQLNYLTTTVALTAETMATSSTAAPTVAPKAAKTTTAERVTVPMVQLSLRGLQRTMRMVLYQALVPVLAIPAMALAIQQTMRTAL